MQLHYPFPRVLLRIKEDYDGVEASGNSILSKELGIALMLMCCVAEALSVPSRSGSYISIIKLQ